MFSSRLSGVQDTLGSHFSNNLISGDEAVSASGEAGGNPSDSVSPAESPVVPVEDESDVLVNGDNVPSGSGNKPLTEGDVQSGAAGPPKPSSQAETPEVDLESLRLQVVQAFLDAGFSRQSFIDKLRKLRITEPLFRKILDLQDVLREKRLSRVAQKGGVQGVQREKWCGIDGFNFLDVKFLHCLKYDSSFSRVKYVTDFTGEITAEWFSELHRANGLAPLIILDEGSNFTALEIDRWFRLRPQYHAHLAAGTAHHSLGKVERRHRYLKDVAYRHISTIESQKPTVSDIVRIIYHATEVVNTNPIASLGYLSPFELEFVSPIDNGLVVENSDRLDPDMREKRALRIVYQEILRQRDAADGLSRIQFKSGQTRTFHHDDKVEFKDEKTKKWVPGHILFTKGEKVWIQLLNGSTLTRPMTAIRLFVEPVNLETVTKRVFYGPDSSKSSDNGPESSISSENFRENKSERNVAAPAPIPSVVPGRKRPRTLAQRRIDLNLPNWVDCPACTGLHKSHTREPGCMLVGAPKESEAGKDSAQPDESEVRNPAARTDSETEIENNTPNSKAKAKTKSKSKAKTKPKSQNTRDSTSKKKKKKTKINYVFQWIGAVSSTVADSANIDANFNGKLNAKTLNSVAREVLAEAPDEKRTAGVVPWDKNRYQTLSDMCISAPWKIFFKTGYAQWKPTFAGETKSVAMRLPKDDQRLIVLEPHSRIQKKDVVVIFLWKDGPYLLPEQDVFNGKSIVDVSYSWMCQHGLKAEALWSIRKEFGSVDKYKVWKQVSADAIPRGGNVLNARIILSLKYNSVSKVLSKPKCRVVAKGFQDRRLQNEQFRTDSPTVALSSILFALTFSASNPTYRTEVCDLTCAFLQGDKYPESEQIFLKLPVLNEEQTVACGFEFTRGQQVYLRVLKSLYGLADAPRQWWIALRRGFTDLGFVCLPSDQSVFVLHETVEKSSDSHGSVCEPAPFLSVNAPPPPGKIIGVVVCHVDDCLMVGNDHFWNTMKKFPFEATAPESLSREGDTLTYTAMNIVRTSTGYLVDQNAYSTSLEEMDCEAIQAEHGEQWVEHETALHAYRMTIGKCNFATRLIPQRTFQFSERASAMSKPEVKDFKALNHFVRKLRYTVHPPIKINALDLSSTKIAIFNDAAYTLANSARSGYLIFLRDDSLRANLLCFKGYKQGRVCGGVLQAETLTAMDGLNKGEHVKGVGISMGCVPYGAVNEDYTDSKNLVMQVESTSQSFQDQRALHLINQLRQRVSEEKLKLYFLPATLQIADPLTKQPSATDDLLNEVIQQGSLKLVLSEAAVNMVCNVLTVLTHLPNAKASLTP